MPWQEVVGVIPETGGLVVESSTADQYEVHMTSRVEELLDEGVELYVKVERYPEWQPNRFQAWHSPDRHEEVLPHLQ